MHTQLACLGWSLLVVGGFAAVAGGADTVRHVALAPDEKLAGKATVVVQTDWGAARGELGKEDEASRPGPMDFAVQGDTLYVLDAVNGRVALFGLDGDCRGAIPLGTRTADFLCLDERGGVTVLDAFSRREVRAFSAAGQLTYRAPVPEAIALPSAVMLDGERLLIESRHKHVYELDVQQARTGRRLALAGRRDGRPRADGGCVQRARKTGTHGVVVRTAAEGAAAAGSVLVFPQPVISIAALESDAAGNSYVAVVCGSAPGTEHDTELVLAILTPEGEVRDVAQLPNAYVTDHYRKVFVTPAGAVYQMQTKEEEVRFVRWTPAGSNGKGVAQ